MRRREGDDERKPGEGPEETRDVNWTTCPQHGVPHRRGDTCPLCEREQGTR